MFGLRRCNQRAVICPIVLISALALLIVPASAEVFLTDDAGGVAGQRFGASAAGTGDINADGAWEFLVGAPGDDSAGSDAGAAFFWYGGRALAVAPDALWTGTTGGDQYGWSVACVGDVNGGGRDDWAIGAPTGSTGGGTTGYVHLFFGEFGLSQTPRVIAGEIGGDNFGFDIAAAGDMNGDTIDDFIVGAPYNDAGAIEQGAAYVIYGDAIEGDIGLDNSLKLAEGVAYAHFGWAVTGVGNFLNTDACVAVGAPGHDSARGTEAGGVWVFADDSDATADETIDVGSTRAYSWYGYALDNAGHWNGDGYDDLVVGAPNNASLTNNAGLVDIVYGGTSISSSGDVTIYGAAADDAFGWSVAGVRHVTGSGADDVLIGAPAADTDGLNAGRAYLLAGGGSSATALPVSIMDPGRVDQAEDEIGYAVASAGDFDADGLWDYAVGAPNGNIADGPAAGVCRLVDAAELVVRNELALWDAAWSDDGGVSLQFRLELPDDAVESLRLVREEPSARTTVWDGPALPWASLDAPPADGTLYRLGTNGYAFVDLDAVSGDVAYELTARGADGSEAVFTALAGPAAPLPAAATVVEMAPAWPNPFNPTVQIRFRAPAGEALRCRVADVRGHHVRDLLTGTASGEWRTVIWDGRADDGSSLASGVYLVRLETESGEAVQRVVLTK